MHPEQDEKDRNAADDLVKEHNVEKDLSDVWKSLDAPVIFPVSPASFFPVVMRADWVFAGVSAERFLPMNWRGGGVALEQREPPESSELICSHQDACWMEKHG